MAIIGKNGKMSIHTGKTSNQGRQVELYEQRIKELKTTIQQEAKTDEDMQRLQTVAGVGPIVAAD